MLEQLHFAFIGGGNMAEALLKGLLCGLNVAPTHVTVTDVIPARLDYLHTTYGIGISTDNPQTVGDHEVIILAVKPRGLFPPAHA